MNVSVELQRCLHQNANCAVFVDDGSQEAKNILGELVSAISCAVEARIELLQITFSSISHQQFEEIYGETPPNSVTFVAYGGAALLRWDGDGELKDAVQIVANIQCVDKTAFNEFGYPLPEFAALLRNDDTEAQQPNTRVVPTESQNVADYCKDRNFPSQGSGNGVKVDTAPCEKTSYGSPKVDGEGEVSSLKETHDRNFAVLQVRSPEGTSFTRKFNIQCHLSEVKEEIRSYFSSHKSFGLATSFPRYYFTEQDYLKTLDELKLWPNAVLLIVPVVSSQILPSTSLMWRFVAAICSWTRFSFIFVWRTFSRVFPGVNEVTQPSNESQRASQSNHSVSSISVRRRRNIHTLQDTDDDKDDQRKTYNGNSTQQL